MLQFAHATFYILQYDGSEVKSICGGTLIKWLDFWVEEYLPSFLRLGRMVRNVWRTKIYHPGKFYAIFQIVTRFGKDCWKRRKFFSEASSLKDLHVCKTQASVPFSIDCICTVLYSFVRSFCVGIVSLGCDRPASNIMDSLIFLIHQAAHANKLLGYIRRNARYIRSTSTRRTLYLGLVRAHFAYATQSGRLRQLN